MAALSNVFGLGLFRAVNVDLRLDDRHEAGGEDLPGYLELLAHDTLDYRPHWLA